MSKGTTGMELTALSDHDSLFVKNNTKTDFNLQVTDPQGRTTIVTIPRTFIPVDLTNWMPIANLKDSQELRRALVGNILTLVSREEARAIIETEEGRLENERVMNKLNLVTEDLLASNNDEEDSSALEAAAIGNMDNVNDQIRDAFADKEMSNSERLALIISLDREEPRHLKKDDFDFIISVADSSMTEIIKYANKRIKEFTGLLSSSK